MMVKDAAYESFDFEAIKILEDFLPDKIFDAHAHLFDTKHLPDTEGLDAERVIGDLESYKEAMMPMLCNPEKLRINMITYPEKSMKSLHSETLQHADAFLVEQLKKDEANVGEILVRPGETAEQIEKRLVHPNIRGFKCYHLLADREFTWHASIGEYLPESAWQVAHEKKMCITLHMVRDHALSDEGNLSYIRTMAKRYPDATLILAHAARSFAAWTGIEAVEKVADLPNVWFDFSAICESPAMLQIIKKAGISRCMWGSDFPISAWRGKAISLGDSFFWIYQKELDSFSGNTAVHHYLVGIENLMAMRQLCQLAELDRSQVEDLFYNNAARLWG